MHAHISHSMHIAFRVGINVPYSRKIYRGLNLAKWRKKGCILILVNLNLAIWNCACDLMIFTLDVNRSAFSMAYTSSLKLRMETFEVDSCIQGYHVFESIWNPTTGEELNCRRERTNTKDPYTVAVIRRSAVVGHVPRKVSLFLRRRGTIRHD